MELDDLVLRTPLNVNTNEMVVVYYQDGKVSVVYISLKEDENIGVLLEKGYVIARTQYETKFVCKGKDFICLWK